MSPLESSRKTSLIVHGDNNKFIRCKQKESTGKEEEFMAGIGFYWLFIAQQ